MTTNVANGPPAPQPAVRLPTLIPLPSAKTITLTIEPDWNQYDTSSPFTPTHVKILMGPPDTTPETATWSFEYKLSCQEPSKPLYLCVGEQNIENLTGKPLPRPRGVINKAVLWQDGKPFSKYKNCVVPSGCKLDDTDIKTHSIIMRPYAVGHDISLIWRNSRVGDDRESHLIAQQAYCSTGQTLLYKLDI